MPPPSDAWQRYNALYGLPVPDNRPSPGFEYFFMVIEAAANGMGVALLPQFLAQDAVASGRLMQALEQTQRNDKAYYIAHATGVGQMRKIRLAKNWLLAEAQRL